jgi:hypothetical protein
MRISDCGLKEGESRGFPFMGLCLKREIISRKGARLAEEKARLSSSANPHSAIRNRKT